LPRYQLHFRSNIDEIKSICLLAPSGERVSLAELCKISVDEAGPTDVLPQEEEEISE